MQLSLNAALLCSNVAMESQLNFGIKQASNVMISHLPAGDYSLEESSKKAKLQYYTNDSFLDSHGGNFYSAFNQHYPLSPQKDVEGRFI